MKSIKEQQKTAYEAMKEEFGYKNLMAAPKIEKVILSVGTGRKSRFDKNANDFIADRIATITGQKAATRGAKKSIATFKIRTGDPVGQMVTLRREKMFSFLDKLINIALPRTKDFRGIKRTSVDAMGNLTMGIKEHTIFPELSEEELKDVFSLAITVVTTAKTKKEAMKFFELIGVPFIKEEEK